MYRAPSRCLALTRQVSFESQSHARGENFKSFFFITLGEAKCRQGWGRDRIPVRVGVLEELGLGCSITLQDCFESILGHREIDACRGGHRHLAAFDESGPKLGHCPHLPSEEMVQ